MPEETCISNTPSALWHITVHVLQPARRTASSLGRKIFSLWARAVVKSVTAFVQSTGTSPGWIRAAERCHTGPSQRQAGGEQKKLKWADLPQSHKPTKALDSLSSHGSVRVRTPTCAGTALDVQAGLSWSAGNCKILKTHLPFPNSSPENGFTRNGRNTQHCSHRELKTNDVFLQGVCNYFHSIVKQSFTEHSNEKLKLVWQVPSFRKSETGIQASLCPFLRCQARRSQGSSLNRCSEGKASVVTLCCDHICPPAPRAKGSLYVCRL